MNAKLSAKKWADLANAGEKADELLRTGQSREALEAFQKLTHKIEDNGEWDSYLIAKTTLGTLRCLIKLGDFKSAYAIWNASMEDGIYGVGIYALENAQGTVADLLTYDMMCAFLHTLGDLPENEAANRVNQYLSRVCEQAEEDHDHSVLRMAINNWKNHLKAIYEGPVPLDSARLIAHYERSLGETVKQKPIEFPPSSRWEKPEDFREMSQLIQSDALTGSNQKTSKIAKSHQKDSDHRPQPHHSPNRKVSRESRRRKAS